MAYAHAGDLDTLKELSDTLGIEAPSVGWAA